MAGKTNYGFTEYYTDNVVNVVKEKQLKRGKFEFLWAYDDKLFSKCKVLDDVVFDYSTMSFISLKPLKEQHNYVFLDVIGPLRKMADAAFELADSMYYEDVVTNKLENRNDKASKCMVVLLDADNQSENFFDNIVLVPFFATYMPKVKLQKTLYADVTLLLNDIGTYMLGKYITFPDDVVLAEDNIGLCYYAKAQGIQQKNMQKAVEQSVQRASVINQILVEYGNCNDFRHLAKFFANLEDNTKSMLLNDFCVYSLEKCQTLVEKTKDLKAVDQLLDVQQSNFKDLYKQRICSVDQYIDYCDSKTQEFDNQIKKIASLKNAAILAKAPTM